MKREKLRRELNEGSRWKGKENRKDYNKMKGEKGKGKEYIKYYKEEERSKMEGNKYRKD